MEYPVNICHPKSIKVLRGYDVQNSNFSPSLSKGGESAVVLFIGDAGPGKLEAELVSPSGGKVKADVTSQKDRAEIRFKALEGGEYALYIKFNGFLLPFCPMRGLVDDNNRTHGTTGKVKLTGMGLVKAQCHEDNFFLIDGSKAAKGGAGAGGGARCVRHASCSGHDQRQVGREVVLAQW